MYGLAKIQRDSKYPIAYAPEYSRNFPVRHDRKCVCCSQATFLLTKQRSLLKAITRNTCIAEPREAREGEA